jgi:putative membrane protein
MTQSKAGPRVTAIVAAVIGLFLATAVIGYFDVGAVLAAMAPIGVWGFAAVIVAQLALYAPLGLAWWLVAPGAPLRRLGVFVWASLLAEAATNLLPFSQVGGMVLASRAAVLGGVPAATALGSNLVDITLEVAAQLIYTLVGLTLLAHHLGLGRRSDPLLEPLLAGVGFTACLVAAFVVTQRRGLPVLERLIARLVPAADHDAGAVGRVFEAAYRRPLRLWACLGLHLLAWFATAAGTWLILAFIGRPLPFASVVAIESLLFAIRNAAFFVPAALGVQEGAYALLGPLFGLPAEAALALSLLKRARDIAVAVPMLLSWQAVELRQPLRRRRSEPAE